MIGALIAIFSLNMTEKLVENFGIVARTLEISGVTQTTPIQVSCPNHNVPKGRVLHAVVSGVTGTIEANGTWEMTPIDENTLSLATYSPQGIVTNSVGVNAWTGGGIIQYAFPDFQILLGRQLKALASQVASPRIIFIPTDEPAFIYESYGGVGAPAESPPVRGSLEQQYQTLNKLYATQCTTFEVYVTGAANPPQPNFGDFDATQMLVWILYQVLFESCADDVAKVLRGTWISQKQDAGSMTQRGQQWLGIVQIKQPVSAIPKEFVPEGTTLVLTVEPVNALVPTDQTVITVAQRD